MLRSIAMGFTNIYISKKDGSVQWVSDFQELNKVIQRHKYPLPRIHDMLTRRSEFYFFLN